MTRTAPSPAAPTAPPPRVPGWALPDGNAAGSAEAAFLAGAALNSLDHLVRSEPEWAGAWRQRLALSCAAANVRLAGRSEDEAALRDAWYLRPADADPGPAGNIFAAWRLLASRPAEADAGRLEEIADLLGLRRDGLVAELPGMIDEVARSGQPAPFAAAAIAGRTVALLPDAEPLGWWLADLMLARVLRWPRPVSLLMARAFSPVMRGGGARGRRIRPGEADFERVLCLALAQGAAEACRQAAEIARRAERLAAAVPKLRAKGAGEAIRLLLDDDAVPGTLTTRRLSRFGARRLFERLKTFDAVNELSGRSSFRIYGL